MRARTIPRGAVLVLAALIIALPTVALSGALDLNKYRLTGDGHVKHRHTDTYGVYAAPMSNEGNLRDRIVKARQNWNDRLTEGPTGSAATTLSTPSRSTLPSSEISFNADFNVDNNLKLMIVAPYHGGANPSDPAQVTFNRSYTGGMDGDEKQTLACRAVGQVLGLEPRSGRNDCMDGDATNKPEVKEESIALVDDFYGPVVSFAGTLFAKRGETIRRNGSYSVSASATGHELDRVTLKLRTVETIAGPSTATRVLSAPPATACPDGNDRCNASATASASQLALGTLEPGKYRLIAETHTELGKTRAASFDSTSSTPGSGSMTPFTLRTGTRMTPTTNTRPPCLAERTPFATT